MRASSGAARNRARPRAAPTLALIQNSAETWAWLMSCLWIVAAESPNSLTRSRTAPMAATMASKPKADGGSRRARTTNVATWASTRTSWPDSSTTPPRRERRLRSWVKWSVASSASGDGAPVLGRDMFKIPAIGLRQALREWRAGAPAELIDPADIDHLARRAVGPGRVEADTTLIAHGTADHADQVDD